MPVEMPPNNVGVSILPSDMKEDIAQIMLKFRTIGVRNFRNFVAYAKISFSALLVDKSLFSTYNREYI